MITLDNVAFLKKSIDYGSLESKALDMRQSCARMGKRIDDLKDRLLDELETQWNHLGLDEQMSYVERIASLCNGSQLLGVYAAPKAKADGQEVETEKPA